MLPAVPGPAVPAVLADRAQPQALLVKLFTAKGPPPRIRQGMTCGSRAAPSASVRLPKAWARQDLRGGIPAQQKPRDPRMHFCVLSPPFISVSLYGLITGLCVAMSCMYPLRAVSYKATGHEQQQLGLPRVPRCGSLKRSTSGAVMGKGCSCLSRVPVWGCVHM